MPAKEQQAKATECAKARDDQRREQSDLDQQTRAANAGSILVHLTKHQTRIALLQAVLSLLAVVATGLAAWAAVVAANAARSSVEDARKDAAEQAERFGHQLHAAQSAADAASRGARATGRLATEAARQVKVSERATERQLRAYLSIRSVSVADFKVGAHPILNVCVRNTGQTPAKHVSARVEMRRSGAWESERAHFVEAAFSRLEIGGQVETTQEWANDFLPLTEEQLVEFRAGLWGYAIFGLITYRDVFGKLRRLTFRGNVDHFAEKPGEDMAVYVSAKGVRST